MKPVFIAASPNTEKDDIALAAKLLLKPWRWYHGYQAKRKELEHDFSLYHGGKPVYLLDSARSAFYLLLKLYGVGPGDEVILPSFSCLVVANPVKWVGAKPIYVDIDPRDYNLDLEDLKRKISKRTKVILLQHTFGKVVSVDRVREIAGADVKLVEDCAHALGGEKDGRRVGTLGDAAIFTFGIEKVISSVRGGVLLLNDTETKMAEDYRKLPDFPRYKLFFTLINPLLWQVITKVYYWGIGKLTLGRMITLIGHKFGLLGNMLESCEYRTEKPGWIPARMPDAIAVMALHQFHKLERFNRHRSKIATIYATELRDYIDSEYFTANALENQVWLRFPLQVPAERLEALRQYFKRRKVVIGDWYKQILYAGKYTLDLLDYNQGETAAAEKVTNRIINLPTAINVSPDQAREISRYFKEFREGPS